MSDEEPAPQKEDDAAAKPRLSAELNADEQAEVQRLEVLIQAGRERPARTGSLMELKWLLYITVVLLIVAVVSYLVLHAPDRRVVALMASIAGGVVSGWGALKGLSCSRGGVLAAIGGIYAAFFGGMALVFGIMGAGLMGLLDGK